MSPLQKYVLKPKRRHEMWIVGEVGNRRRPIYVTLGISATVCQSELITTINVTCITWIQKALHCRFDLQSFMIKAWPGEPLGLFLCLYCCLTPPLAVCLPLWQLPLLFYFSTSSCRQKLVEVAHARLKSELWLQLFHLFLPLHSLLTNAGLIL